VRDYMILEPLTAGCQYPGITLNNATSKHLAQKWTYETFYLPSWDTPIGMDQNLELAVTYFFFGNAINFGFYPDRDTLGPVGSINFWLALRSHPELLSASCLSRISRDDFQAVFGPLPLLDDRIKIWQETAKTLRIKYNGKVTELYEANHWNAPEIVQAITTDFPSFRDSQSRVHFARRAQLTLFMTHSRFQDNMVFTNLERLPVCADLQVFNGLLQLGVLELSKEILETLTAGFIPARSDLEFALRCWTILGAETLLTEINLHRKEAPITICQLDYLLRQTGTNGKAPLPLAQTTSY